MEQVLDAHDVGHSLHVEPLEDGSLHANFFDLALPRHRELLMQHEIGFGLTFGAHTLAAYRRLPHGWRTTPPGIATDLYMWQQFLAETWCRAGSLGDRHTALLRSRSWRWTGPVRTIVHACRMRAKQDRR
jgi:hypothetical protein